MKALSKTLTLIPSIFATTLVVAADQPVEHETVIVTANRTATTVDDTISSVIVITEDEIQRSQARSVPELLQSRSGINFASNGGRGQLASSFIRGTNSDHVVILVDGVKIAKGSLGSISWEVMPINQIERVEVVKGPRASLYGSEAIGGVIQIFTKKGGKEQRNAVTVSAGDYATGALSASTSGSFDKLSYSVGISGETTDGYDVFEASEPDHDGYNNKSANINLAYHLGETELTLTGLKSIDDVEYDGGFSNQSDRETSIYALGMNSALTDQWFLDLKVSFSEDTADDFNAAGTRSNFNHMERKGVSLLNEFTLSNEQSVVLATDYYKDTLDSLFSSAPPNRENIGAAVQYLGTFGSHTVELSARHDDNQQYGSANTGSIGYAYELSPNLSATASYGTAFNAPTFGDISSSAPGDTIQPEESRSAELGLRWSEKTLAWKVAVYNTEIDDIILYDFGCSCTRNVDKVKIRGIDIDVDKQVSEHLGATLAVSFLNAENAGSGANNGNELERRPSSSARLGVYYDVEQWKHTAELRVAGSAYSNAANTQELDPYRVLNLMTEYNLSESLSIAGKLTNVFDSHYETVSGYNPTPRSVLLTLRYAN